MKTDNDKVKAVTIYYMDGSEKYVTDSWSIDQLSGLSSVISFQEYEELMQLLNKEDGHHGTMSN